MRRHHYGKSRYDLTKAGCLTVNAKVAKGKLDEVKETIIKYAMMIDDLSDFDFKWKTWWYEQNFNCKLGTTEMLVECMLAEKFLNDFWHGRFTKDDHFEEMVIEISTDELYKGKRYDKACWFKNM